MNDNKVYNANGSRVYLLGPKSRSGPRWGGRGGVRFMIRLGREGRREGKSDVSRRDAHSQIANRRRGSHCWSLFTTIHRRRTSEQF